MKIIWSSLNNTILMRSKGMMHSIVDITWVNINHLHCWTNDHFSILQKTRETLVGI